MFIERIGGHNNLLGDEMSRAENETSGSYFNKCPLDVSKVEDKHL
jgi:hypothetical protein